ncbi:hypothetical protein ABZ905_31645 [Streptomyces parvus]|uniref:hypothetical protein n=1 Tax=Streptomyces parvus TaxID=66428 RepID=UPI0033FECE98
MSAQPDDQETPAVDHGDLALRAAVAYRVKQRIGEICDPLIAANADNITDTKGLRSTRAEMPLSAGGTLAVGTFTRSVSKPKFVVADREAFLGYADEKGETEYVVRPAFEKGLLGRLKYDPQSGDVVDPTSGEVIPGVTYEPGGDTLSVRPSWDTDGITALDDRLGFLDMALEKLPTLTSADFYTALEAGK